MWTRTCGISGGMMGRASRAASASERRAPAGPRDRGGGKVAEIRRKSPSPGEKPRSTPSRGIRRRPRLARPSRNCDPVGALRSRRSTPRAPPSDWKSPILPTPNEETEAAPSFGTDEPAPRVSPGRAPRRLLALSRGDGGRVLSVVLLGAVVASAAFLRVSLIKPLLDDVVLPKTAGDLDMDLLWPHIESIATIAGATLLVSPLAVLGRSYLAEWVAGRVRQRVDIAIARKLLHVPLRTFREGSSGDFLSRSMADAQIACQMVVLFYKDVILHAEMILIGVAMMLWISAPSRWSS